MWGWEKCTTDTFMEKNQNGASGRMSSEVSREVVTSALSGRTRKDKAEVNQSEVFYGRWGWVPGSPPSPPSCASSPLSSWGLSILSEHCQGYLYSCITWAWVQPGSPKLWQAIWIAWFARANCVGSTSPCCPAWLLGSETPTRYAAWGEMNRPYPSEFYVHRSSANKP